ncbi:hypothetical protein JE959_000123 [Aeromonas veronii]|nr:hypothetical protein [Aeromonas veronii]
MNKVSNIYLELCNIAIRESQVSSSEGVSFFSLYQNDLFRNDREILENFTKSGTFIIWILKAGGAGTAILFTGTEYAVSAMKLQSEQSQFYLISCDGRNSGSVTRLSSHEEAMRAVKEKPFIHFDPKNKAPDVFRELLRLDESTSLPYELRKLNLVEGDRTMIKMQLFGAKYLTLSILKNRPDGKMGSKVADWHKPEEFTFKCHSELLLEILRSGKMTEHIIIETGTGGVCTYRKISEREFNNAANIVTSRSKSKGLASNEQTL